MASARGKDYELFKEIV